MPKSRGKDNRKFLKHGRNLAYSEKGGMWRGGVGTGQRGRVLAKEQWKVTELR